MYISYNNWSFFDAQMLPLEFYVAKNCRLPSALPCYKKALFTEQCCQLFYQDFPAGLAENSERRGISLAPTECSIQFSTAFIKRD
jgi:hypothetical protein